MAATQDIFATYRGPDKVVRRLIAGGPGEDRALIYLMLGCLMVFIAQTPRLAREAHLAGAELNSTLGATLFAWLFIAPLILYGLAAISHLVARAFGGQGSGFGARVALFWALLASSPLMLLWGLTAGFIGPGPALTLVGVLWLGCFLWFWISGLMAAERGQE